MTLETFGELPAKSAMPSTARRCCLLHLITQNCCRNSNLDDSGISLLAFLSRTNLKLHNIRVTPKVG